MTAASVYLSAEAVEDRLLVRGALPGRPLNLLHRLAAACARRQHPPGRRAGHRPDAPGEMPRVPGVR